MSQEATDASAPEEANDSKLVLDTSGASLAVIETPVAIGDRVVVHGTFGGFLRYWGPVQFSHGLWAGVELDEPGMSYLFSACCSQTLKRERTTAKLGASGLCGVIILCPPSLNLAI